MGGLHWTVTSEIAGSIPVRGAIKKGNIMQEKMLKEKDYMEMLYVDLVSFLINHLLKNAENKKELSQMFLNAWETRNKKTIETKLTGKIKGLELECEEEKLTEFRDSVRDSMTVLMSTHELIFDSIRDDIMKTLKTGIIDVYAHEEQKK